MGCISGIRRRTQSSMSAWLSDANVGFRIAYGLRDFPITRSPPEASLTPRVSRRPDVRSRSVTGVTRPCDGLGSVSKVGGRTSPWWGQDRRKAPVTAHPLISRGVGIHRRATTIDRLRAQFVVPGLVTVYLAQPILGAMLRQPRRGIQEPDVDREPGHVSGRVHGGDPSGSFLFRAVLRDRLTKELILVLGGAPAAVDGELDAVVTGIRRRFAQGLEEIGVEVGYAGISVIEHGHAVGEGTVILGDGTVSLGGRSTVVAARDSADRGRRSRC